jgi:hypothetical protein
VITSEETLRTKNISESVKFPYKKKEWSNLADQKEIGKKNKRSAKFPIQ